MNHEPYSIFVILNVKAESVTARALEEHFSCMRTVPLPQWKAYFNSIQSIAQLKYWSSSKIWNSEKKCIWNLDANNGINFQFRLPFSFQRKRIHIKLNWTVNSRHRVFCMFQFTRNCYRYQNWLWLAVN